MKIETKYDIWDEIETILWDIGIIVSIEIRTDAIKYCMRLTDDKVQWLYDWQIAKFNKKNYRK